MTTPGKFAKKPMRHTCFWTRSLYTTYSVQKIATFSVSYHSTHFYITINYILNKLRTQQIAWRQAVNILCTNDYLIKVSCICASL